MTPAPSTILNVNDDEPRRYVVTRILRRARFDVIEAASGAEALAAVARVKPDIVVLDVRLPDIDGFEVCRRIKEAPTTASVAVIMLSAVLTENSDRVQGLESGADAYLTDPHPTVTLATVRALLRARDAEKARVESEAQYRVLFDANPLPAWVVDAETRVILEVNAAAVREYGYSRDELRSTSFAELGVASRDRRPTPRATPDVFRLGRHARKDGTVLDVDVTTRETRYGGRDAILVIAMNVTEQRRAERRRAAQFAVTRVLAESPSLAVATPWLLQAICEGFGWDVGELWRGGDGGRPLTLLGAWQWPGADGGSAAPDATIGRGARLADRVWERGVAEWMEDVGAAPGDALHAAIAFPIVVGTRKTGVMVFWSREIHAPDRTVLVTIADLGAQIGQFVERKEAEERLRQADARYRLAARATNDVIWDWDALGDRMFLGDTITALLGYAPGVVIDGRAWWAERLHPEDRSRVLAKFDDTLGGTAEVWSDEYRFRMASGLYLPIRNRGYIIRDASGRPVRMVGALMDMTELHVKEERNRLRALSVGMLRAKEEEARRIAHELHNEASQLLAGVHITLDQIIRDVPPALRDRFGVVRDLLGRTEQHLRGLAHELRPAILDDLGLRPALDGLAQLVTSRSGVGVTVDAPAERLPPMIETALYRIVQEALANATKHGAAGSVAVVIARDDVGVRCTIADDGVGFDVTEALVRPEARGLGLLGIRERAEALGGALTIFSSPGSGTELLVVIPIDPADVDPRPAR